MNDFFRKSALPAMLLAFTVLFAGCASQGKPPPRISLTMHELGGSDPTQGYINYGNPGSARQGQGRGQGQQRAQGHGQGQPRAQGQGQGQGQGNNRKKGGGGRPQGQGGFGNKPRGR